MPAAEYLKTNALICVTHGTAYASSKNFDFLKTYMEHIRSQEIKEKKRATKAALKSSRTWAGFAKYVLK